MDTTHTLMTDAQYVWHPYTAIPHTGPRTSLVRAEGAFLWDESGHRLYDATSSWWSQIHGHCHPRLVDALSKQASTLDQVLFAPHTHPVAARLSEKLVRTIGAPFQRVFYSDDGSTAVEAALKMAAQYWQNKGQPQRRHFLSIEEGYHGDTLGAVSVGYVKEFHHFFDKVVQPSLMGTFPYCYRCPLEKTYPSCQVACLDKTKSILEKHGSEIAAFIVEPLVMGAAGMVMYPKEYLEQTIKLCREHGVLVIFDEVFTGFGRTGKMFAADHFDALSLKPDMICLSKGLTSGMLALGATLATEEIYQAFCGSEEKKFYHGHTFTANALACSVALESLKIFEDEGVLVRNERLAQVMRDETPRFERLANVGEVRQIGVIWALEIVEDKVQKNTLKPANKRGWAICERMWERGIWARPMGGVLYLVPPYCTSEQDLRHAFDVLYQSICEEFRIY